MRLQKHERQAIEAAVEEAGPRGCTVEVLGHDGTTHLTLMLIGRRGSRKVPIASSPKNRDHCIRMVRRMVRRIVAELS